MTGHLAVWDPVGEAPPRRISVGAPVFDSTPLLVEETAFVGSMRGDLVGVDLGGGAVLCVRLGGYVVADPVRCGAFVVAASSRGRLCSVRWPR
jgi:hypothetical protein